jgi:hypothetical protein
MPDRFLPEKIRDFLMQRPGRRYCDSCIQERLGLRWRQQVQLVTATLAVTKSFSRDRSDCCTCNEVKQVIAAVQTSSGNEAPLVPRTEERSSAPKKTPARDVKLVLLQRSRLSPAS